MTNYTLWVNDFVAPPEGKFKSARQRKVAAWKLFQRFLEDSQNHVNPFRDSRISSYSQFVLHREQAVSIIKTAQSLNALR